jgi:hypothetical protein
VAGVPWKQVFVWALAGLTIGMSMWAYDYFRTVDHYGSLVVTEQSVPAAPILAAELGPRAVNARTPHDGAFFYVIAREPMDLNSAAEGLDRPRYRLQRILFPWLGWALHPTGGGEGLVWALFAVGVVGVFAGAVAMGALSTSLRGPPWLAVLFPLFGGSITSLRITTPDPLAVALALWAVFFGLQRKTGAAVALGVAAVLTKETTLLVLLGFTLWDRSRRGILVTVGPGAVAFAWWVWLRVTVPSGDVAEVIEFTTPLQGWWASIRHWQTGAELPGMSWFLLAVVVALAALARGGLRHPLGWIVALNLLLTIFLIGSAIAPTRSAGRTTLAMVAAGAIVLATANKFPSPLDQGYAHAWRPTRLRSHRNRRLDTPAAGL